jgi:hypothetical protein
MCRQAERDHESKKLVVLMDRVKRQIAARKGPELVVDAPKPPMMAMSNESGASRLPSRVALFER